MRPPSSPSAPRILVADDDPGIRRMVELVLASEGFDVTVASDGQRGLELFLGGQFDVVVLDLQMPRMDGRALYRELRERGHDVPVIVLSAYGATTAADELGAEAAMGKPFDIDDFIECIRSLLPESTTA